MKHTPGERYIKQNHGQWWVETDETVIAILESKAEAELLAAAPAMLQTLKACRISIIADEYYQEFKPLLKTIDSVLASLEEK
jgi:hypothetical protein